MPHDGGPGSATHSLPFHTLRGESPAGGGTEPPAPTRRAVRFFRRMWTDRGVVNACDATSVLSVGLLTSHQRNEVRSTQGVVQLHAAVNAYWVV